MAHLLATFPIPPDWSLFTPIEGFFFRKRKTTLSGKTLTTWIKERETHWFKELWFSLTTTAERSQCGSGGFLAARDYKAPRSLWVLLFPMAPMPNPLAVAPRTNACRVISAPYNCLQRSLPCCEAWYKARALSFTVFVFYQEFWVWWFSIFSHCNVSTPHHSLLLPLPPFFSLLIFPLNSDSSLTLIFLPKWPLFLSSFSRLPWKTCTALQNKNGVWNPSGTNTSWRFFREPELALALRDHWVTEILETSHWHSLESLVPLKLTRSGLPAHPTRVCLQPICSLWLCLFYPWWKCASFQLASLSLLLMHMLSAKFLFYCSLIGQ